MKDITINETKIRVDLHGRLSLTDLWKASGSNPSYRPVNFEKTDKARELKGILKCRYPQFEPIVKTQGKYNGGTWAVKELFYLYAMYASTALSLKIVDAMILNESNGELDIALTEIELKRAESIKQKLESGALSAIEQLLSIKLIRQYQIGSYRIDGYHEESNTAYEIDEPQHFVDGELRQECKDRQAYIESKFGCKFVRIKV